MTDLFLLFTIIKRSDSKEYERFYRDHGVQVSYSLLGNGTAQAKHPPSPRLTNRKRCDIMIN